MATASVNSAHARTYATCRTIHPMDSGSARAASAVTWRTVAPQEWDLGRCGVCDGEIRPGDPVYVSASLRPATLHQSRHAPDCVASLTREADGQ